MELVDELKRKGTMTEIKISFDGLHYTGWVNAKPINPRWFRTRIKDAWKVFRGKAIAAQYFDDLNEEEKIEYVKSQVLISK